MNLFPRNAVCVVPRISSISSFRGPAAGAYEPEPGGTPVLGLCHVKGSGSLHLILSMHHRLTRSREDREGAFQGLYRTSRLRV